MSTKRKYADTDDTTSESDFDNSDDDQEVEDESNSWVPLRTEAAAKIEELNTPDVLEEKELG